MKTIYSDTRYEIEQTTGGSIFVTDHAHVAQKTEIANPTQGASIRAMIDEICAESNPADALALVEFLDDACHRVVYRDALIHDKISRELAGH